MKRILFVGESWVIHSTHIKGFDKFDTCTYQEGGKFLLEALAAAGYQVDYIRAHEVFEKFPFKLEELQEYAAVFFSDIGSNTFLLCDDVFMRGQVVPNRLNLVRDYVKNGGGFCMIGGYLSFSGIDAKAQFSKTAINDILPVRIMDTDDRIEACEGLKPVISATEHSIFRDVPADWPVFLGYNRTFLREEGTLLASINDDPFIAVREYGEGRTAVFTSDGSPHWATMEFVNWEKYKTIWKNITDYLTRRI